MKWPAVLCAAKPRSSNSTATSAPVLCPHLPAAGQLRGPTTSTPTYAQQNQRNQQKGYSLVPLVLLDASRQGGRSVANHLAPKRHLVDLAQPDHALARGQLIAGLDMIMSGLPSGPGRLVGANPERLTRQPPTLSST